MMLTLDLTFLDFLFDSMIRRVVDKRRLYFSTAI
jgi:hypothetical protein